MEIINGFICVSRSSQYKTNSYYEQKLLQSGYMDTIIINSNKGNARICNDHVCYMFILRDFPDEKMLEKITNETGMDEFWLQAKSDHEEENVADCYVCHCINGELIYSMNGRIISGEDAAEDNFRKVRDDFNEQCPVLSSGINQFCTDDDQILIRKYADGKTVWQLNGFIGKDLRCEPEKNAREYYRMCE